MQRSYQHGAYGVGRREDSFRFREQDITPERDGFLNNGRSRSRERDNSRRTSDYLNFEPPVRGNDREVSTKLEPLMSVRLGKDRERDLPMSRQSEARRNEIPSLFEATYPLQETNRYNDAPDRPSAQWNYPDTAYTREHLGLGPYQSELEVENLRLQSFAIPEFYPGLSEYNSYEWMDVFVLTAAKYHWSDSTKHTVFSNRLRGRAQQWYSATGINCNSWMELKESFLKTFAYHENFPALLHKMLKRVKLEDEALATYFFNKAELLEVCKITGADAVSCIIDGLENRSMQDLAVDKRFDDADELYRYLVQVFPEPPLPSKMQNARK